MASFSYSDDEDQKRGAQKDKLNAPQAPSGPAPTFAELQRRGMPRPPPMGPAGRALYGAAGQPPPPADSGGIPDRPGSFAQHVLGRGRATPPPTAPAAPPPPRTGPYYTPTGMLDQGNLEGYLYDMLANPTATPTYQNAMRRIGGDIDTDASRRGVYYSTIPVGAYGEAGSNLAAGLQGQAYNQLRGYNQDYEQLLMALLGAT